MRKATVLHFPNQERQNSGKKCLAKDEFLNRKNLSELLRFLLYEVNVHKSVYISLHNTVLFGIN